MNRKADIQRIRPLERKAFREPRISVSDWNRIRTAIDMQQSATASGGIGMHKGVYGAQIVQRRTASGSPPGQIAIVRALGNGLDSTDLEKHFIQVQNAIPSDNKLTDGSWDGSWAIDLNDSMYTVNCEPNILSKQYTQYLVVGENFNSGEDSSINVTPFVDIRQDASGVQIAWRVFSFMLPISDRLSHLKQTDCTVVAAVATGALNSGGDGILTGDDIAPIDRSTPIETVP